MNLKNGYKVMYEVVEGSDRVFYASKTGSFSDKERIASYPIDSVKVIYQDVDGKLYGFTRTGANLDLEALNNTLFSETEVTNTEEPRGAETNKEEAGEEIPAEPTTSYSRKRTKVEEPVVEPELPTEVTEEV